MKLEKFLDMPINDTGESIEKVIQNKEATPEDLKKGLLGFFNNIISDQKIDMSKYEDDKIGALIAEAEQKSK